MATGGFNPNCIVPVTAQVSVGTAAVQLKTSSTLSLKFTVANPSTVAIYVGDLNVSSSRFTVKIIPGSSVTVGPDNFYRNQQESYDLASFYVVATAASKTATLTTFCKGGTLSPF